jgi:AcrR family transcriptional regulator
MDIKDRIIEKTGDLFMRYSIRSITMDEIASQLGISKKTIYQFFTDKDELVEAVVTQEICSNEAECAGFRGKAENAVHEIFIAADELEEMLQAMNPMIMYDLEKHHPKAFKKLRDHKYQFMYNMTLENLSWGMRDGLYRHDLKTDIIAKERIESAFMAFNQDLFPHSRYKISKYAMNWPSCM